MDEISTSERPGTDEVREPTYTSVGNPRRVRI